MGGVGGWRGARRTEERACYRVSSLSLLLPTFPFSSLLVFFLVARFEGGGWKGAPDGGSRVDRVCFRVKTMTRIAAYFSVWCQFLLLLLLLPLLLSVFLLQQSEQWCHRHCAASP